MMGIMTRLPTHHVPVLGTAPGFRKKHLKSETPFGPHIGYYLSGIPIFEAQAFSIFN